MRCEHTCELQHNINSHRHVNGLSADSLQVIGVTGAAVDVGLASGSRRTGKLVTGQSLARTKGVYASDGNLLRSMRNERGQRTTLDDSTDFTCVAIVAVVMFGVHLTASALPFCLFRAAQGYEGILGPATGA
jgi:hypothetical protein